MRIQVVTAGGAVRGGVAHLDAFGYERDLLSALRVLGEEAAASGPDDPPLGIGVVLERLRGPSAPTLFEADPRDRRLQWMVDRVWTRYGARAQLWGECGDPRGPYPPMDIGRIDAMSGIDDIGLRRVVDSGDRFVSKDHV